MSARDRKRPGTRAERGYVLLVVMIFVMLSSAMLAAGYDRMHQIFAAEESSQRMPSASDGIQEALGAGLARLQTGEPAVDAFGQYTCDLRLRESDGDLVRYTLTYTKLVDNQWALEAQPATGAGPDCPPTFTANACPAPL